MMTSSFNRWDKVNARELYNVAEDFFETTNVVNNPEYRAVREEMTSMLRRTIYWPREVGES